MMVMMLFVIVMFVVIAMVVMRVMMIMVVVMMEIMMMVMFIVMVMLMTMTMVLVMVVVVVMVWSGGEGGGGYACQRRTSREHYSLATTGKTTPDGLSAHHFNLVPIASESDTDNLTSSTTSHLRPRTLTSGMSALSMPFLNMYTKLAIEKR